MRKRSMRRANQATVPKMPAHTATVQRELRHAGEWRTVTLGEFVPFTYGKGLPEGQDRAEPADERDAGGDGAGAVRGLVRALRSRPRQDGGPLAPGRVAPRPPRPPLRPLPRPPGAVGAGGDPGGVGGGEARRCRRAFATRCRTCETIKPETPYIALEHMARRSITLSEWSTADGLESNKFEFKKGEILFGKLRPYFHKVGVAPVDGVCSTDIVVVTPKRPGWFGFVLGHVSSVEFVQYADAGSTGTKMPRTNWADMARYEVALPPEVVAGAFTDLVKALVERIIGGIHESRTLAALRDALLPKLIRGEMRVKDAERFLKERGL